MAADADFLNVKQVAAILKLSEPHVTRLCQIPEGKGGIFAKKFGRGRGVWRIPAKRFYKRAGLE